MSVNHSMRGVPAGILAFVCGLSLALSNSARLSHNMKEVNFNRNLVLVLPSEKSVEQLIAQARKLQPKITY